MMELSIGLLSNNWKSSNLFYILKKPFADNNFCLKDWKFEGKVGWLLFKSFLFLGLWLLECNLDFIKVLGIFYDKI